MDTMFEYASDWLTRHGLLFLWRDKFIEHNTKSIEEVERVRPGFAASLLEVARDILDSEDSGRYERALPALAVLGTTDDLARLARLQRDASPDLAKDAKTVAWEIEHRRPAS